MDFGTTQGRLEDISEVPTKEGWLWKRSTGRSSVFGSKNWKMRYFIADVEGVRYYAQEPFNSPKGQIAWAQVTHVYDNCGPSVDADAKDPGKFYFGLRFKEGTDERLLLLRSDNERERASWVSHFEAQRMEFDRMADLIEEEEDDEEATRGLSVFESVHRKLRNIVSLKKQRYQLDGFDLDMAYILPSVIAMGYPSEGKEAVYRNPMDQVVTFFNKYHEGHYKIYNLCSERAYPPSRFHGSFARFPFDDHNPPPLELILPCVTDIHNYLLGSRDAGAQALRDGFQAPPPVALEGPAMLDVPVHGFQRTNANVVAIHCKAGKGRTGIIICCYLLYAGACSDPATALKVFGDRRTKDGKGVQIPSQKRYLGYFHELLFKYNGICPPAMEVNIRSIILSSTPRFDPDGGCDPYVLIHRRTTKHHHVPCGRTEGNFAKPLEQVFDSRNGVILGHIKKRRDIEIPVNSRINADEFCISLWDSDIGAKDDKMCCFWLHGAFLPLDGRYTMTKTEIDDAVKDKKHQLFDEDFTVTIIYEITGTPVTHSQPLQSLQQENVSVPATHPTAYIADTDEGMGRTISKMELPQVELEAAKEHNQQQREAAAPHPDDDDDL